MSKTYKCDRCKSVFGRTDHSDNYRGFRYYSGGVVRSGSVLEKREYDFKRHLCPKCAVDFYYFMDGAKLKKSKDEKKGGK